MFLIGSIYYSIAASKSTAIGNLIAVSTAVIRLQIGHKQLNFYGSISPLPCVLYLIEQMCQEGVK